MLLFKSENLEIYYFKSERLIEARWYGYPSSEEYRNGLASYLEILANYEVAYWLEDYKLVIGINKEDSDWAKAVWAPAFSKIASAKIERMARVITSKRYKEANSKNIGQVPKAMPFPFLTEEFQSYNLALCWLTGKFFLIEDSFGIAV